MSSDHSDERPPESTDDLAPEYHFDSSKAQPNRFAALRPPGSRPIVLEPDIATVLTGAESVNAVLRAVIATMPPGASR